MATQFFPCVLLTAGLWMWNFTGLNEVRAEAVPATNVQVPDGFEATLYADDDLARDIFCMTIDSLGRVTVSGRDYVKILIDKDGDGRADSAKLFADGPKTGAQGMYWLGRDLLCIGDQGLLRYRDQDGDDQADGPPDVFLQCKTGGEHDVHSIQKGPDGWWYVIAGNTGGISSQYGTLPSSPIKQPQHGVLFRLKPDLSGGELLAHGMRNAYDFAFNPQGDVFTYDSDDERDITLPWYRPTRVFQLVTGTHAGWMSTSWKNPDGFIDMPPVVAAFGRGSPTGVLCYRHRQFPAEYRDSLFVMDWTYGRVLTVRLQREGSSYAGQPATFMTATGQHGFAPTDIETAPDGSLFVSVGGRGTRGGVYRVRWKQAPAGNPTSTGPGWPGLAVTPETQLEACLIAPQPLASWSRAAWEPLAVSAGAEAFAAAARDSNRSLNERLRAIEILVEKFSGPDAGTLDVLQKDSLAEIRARTAWAIGRTAADSNVTAALLTSLQDDDPLTGRTASESLLGRLQPLEGERLAVALAKRLGSTCRHDRAAAARLIPQLSKPAFTALSQHATKSGWAAGIANALGYLGRAPGVNLYAFEVGLRVLERDLPLEQKLEAVRLMQLGLGDMMPPGERVAPAFHGYAAALELTNYERELDPFVIRLSERFPSGQSDLDRELSRLLAMLEPFHPELLSRMLAKITDESHPTEDIHYLLCAARIQANRDTGLRAATARALTRIEVKVETLKLPQDSRWNDRFTELYRAHVKLDPALPEALVEQVDFGRPGHVLFMSEVPGELFDQAVDAFARQIEKNPDYRWSNDVVFVFGASSKPEHRQLIRDQFERFNVRGAVLMALSEKPQQDERPMFVAGLEASQAEVLSASLDALEKLPGQAAAAEQIALLRCVRRLSLDKSELPSRVRALKLLQRNSGQEFGSVDEARTAADWQPVLEKATAWLVKTYPEEAQSLSGSGSAEIAAQLSELEAADWEAGDADRGRKLFESRSCVQCHAGGSALGPDLSGVTRRFSRSDLLIAILDPSRDVSSRYQTTMIETKDGRVVTGLIVYESVDGLLLRNSTNQTFRIEATDIETRRTLPQSLMPTGLLKGLQPADVADLYAWLKSLEVQSPDR